MCLFIRTYAVVHTKLSRKQQYTGACYWPTALHKLTELHVAVPPCINHSADAAWSETQGSLPCLQETTTEPCEPDESHP